MVRRTSAAVVANKSSCWSAHLRNGDLSETFSAEQVFLERVALGYVDVEGLYSNAHVLFLSLPERPARIPNRAPPHVNFPGVAEEAVPWPRPSLGGLTGGASGGEFAAELLGLRDLVPEI